MSILPSMRARLLAALAIFLTKPVKRYSPATTTDPESLSAVLRNGDVLLTEGNTRAAALIKRLTHSTWSHVSMYVGPLEEGPDPRCIVEADIAQGVRSIRLSELKGLNIRVLRPIGLNDADRSHLAEWVVSQIGGEYDLKHAWVLARSLLPVPPKLSFPPAPNGITESATRFREHGRPPICHTGRFRKGAGIRGRQPADGNPIRRRHECSSNRSGLP